MAAGSKAVRLDERGQKTYAASTTIRTSKILLKNDIRGESGFPPVRKGKTIGGLRCGTRAGVDRTARMA